jgi:hypothetical protein
LRWRVGRSHRRFREFELVAARVHRGGLGSGRVVDRHRVDDHLAGDRRPRRAGRHDSAGEGKLRRDHHDDSRRRPENDDASERLQARSQRRSA